MICWGSGTKPESIPYTFKNLSQTWVALISKPYLPTASLHFGHFPMCWHHLCQLNLGNKSTAEPPALSPEQRHGQGATETPGQGSCWRKRRAMVVGYPAALSPEQWVPLLPPFWRWGLPHQKAWTPQPYLQCVKQAWISLLHLSSVCCTKSNCVSFVFLSRYISEVKQCDVANGIILTHLCGCY